MAVMHALRLAASIIALFALGGAAAAETAESGENGKNGALIGFSAGEFESVQRKKTAFEARLEWRANNSWWFKPQASATVTSDLAALLAVGVYSELFLTDNFYLSPGFSPVIYMRGRGKDLGHVINYRSQIEAGWRFSSDIRVAISLNHVSNASTGKDNPGSESVVFSVLFPMNMIVSF